MNIYSVAKIEVRAMFRAGNIGESRTWNDKAMYRDDMFVSLWGTQMWWPKTIENMSSSFLWRVCTDSEISADKLLY